MKKAIASAVSTFILLGCPGLPASQAFAQVVAPRAQGPVVPVMSMPIGALGAPSASAALPRFSVTLTAPPVLPVLPSALPSASLGAPRAAAVALPVAAPSAAALQAAPAAALAAPAAAPFAAPRAAAALSEAPSAAPTASKLQLLSRQVAAAVKAAGPVAQASAGDARTLGLRLESLLGGFRAAGADASEVAPEGGAWDSPRGADSGRYFGQPAGRDSIAGAVRDHNARFDPASSASPTPRPAAQGVTPSAAPAPAARDLSMKEFMVLNAAGVVASIAGGLLAHAVLLGLVGTFVVPIPFIYAYVGLKRLAGDPVRWPGLRFDPSVSFAGKEHHLLGGSDTFRSAGPSAQGVTPAQTPAPVRTPFLPKLISAGVALAPAVAIGLPLLAAGSTLAGAAVLAASAALMALPFMGQQTSPVLRAIPGAAVLGLGALTLVSALTGGASLWAGALVALGGWGLIRYGVKADQEDRYDRDKALSAYFGGIGAAALGGLALAGASVLLPAWGGFVALAAHGWFLTGATWASGLLSALLLLHLPGWVGEGVGTAFEGVYVSGRAVHRVLGSLKRDTVLYDRLMSFTKRHLDRSPWNAIWLSGIWIPVWLSEAAMALLSVGAGLAFGAAMAPTLFAWGAVHKLWQKSAATRFLAAWNHFVFDWAQGSKTRVYNRAAKPLAALANQSHGAVSVAASFGLRALQLAWLAYAVASFPFVLAAGFFRAFGQTGGEYDYAKHAPSSLRVDVNDRPDVPRPTDPTDPTQPGKSTFVPRLIASAIALAPLYFLGLPLLAVPFIGQAYALTGLALAAMPFLPANSPKLIKQLPGYLLLGLGLVTTAMVPYLLFGGAGLVTLLGHNAFWMGLVTALSGWGMVRYTGTLGQKEGQKWYSVDDPEYIGAFFGALGVMTGLGVSLLGMAGWLPVALKVGAYATSLLLLMHLPEWVGRGVRTVFDGAWSSVRGFGRVLNFWESDTQFYRNLRKHASYWLDKSVWNGSWLSVIWVPTWAAMLAEGVASLALGLAAGLLRLPLNFAWGAAYGISKDAKATRFIAGFARASFERAEGSKKAVFDRWAAPLIPAMNEADPVSGRPTAKAALAFLAARFLQLAWLARLVLGLPVILVQALLDGARNASGEKQKPNGGDPDDPRRTY